MSFMNVTQQFLNFALSTGTQWVLYLLILCSVLNLAIIIDRIVYLFQFRGDFGEFVRKLSDRLNSNEPHETTAAWCSGQHMLEARVAAAGLSQIKQGERSAEESMNATMIAAKTKLERGTTLLGTLANNTPFIGLFGTIIGIMQAFHALSAKENTDPSFVMASIAEALTATAVGILVAVPAVIAYNFFTRAIRKKMANADATARIVLSYTNQQKGEQRPVYNTGYSTTHNTGDSAHGE
jgi:biopolymer transport protein ExbB